MYCTYIHHETFHINFRLQIRLYNSSLSFTSVGADIDKTMADGKMGVFTYKLHGSMTHQIGSLLPKPGEDPKFAQLYVHDTENETQNRQKVC